MNGNGISSDCNKVKDLKPTVVSKTLAKDSFDVIPLNKTINFKVVFKKTEKTSLKLKMRDFLFWNGTDHETFCEPQNYKLCSSEDCSGTVDDSRISLENNPSTSTTNDGIHKNNTLTILR